MPKDESLSSPGALGKPIVRPARQDDLEAASGIVAADEMAMRQRMHPLNQLAALLQMLLADDARQVWVAEQCGEVIVVAAAAFRERHAHTQTVLQNRVAVA